jgi:hypothetical protein
MPAARVRSLATVAALVGVAVTGRAQPATLDDVLLRAATYVSEFHRQLSSIVAEERYVQDWKTNSRSPSASGFLGHRELKSDLLLVKPGPAAAWMVFRDVFEVDGEPVRDRAERLTRLFLERSATTDEQIRQILAESARYNLGDVQRNVNSPVFPLLFLERANQYRFKFRRSSERIPRAAASDAPQGGAFHTAVEIWVISYEEKEPGTFIRTPEHHDLPVRGRFWIDPATGRVRLSELIAENRQLRATIDASFQSEPLLGLLVPIEMRELYEGRRNGSRIETVATYGRFRQFQVDVSERFLLRK